MGSVHAMRRGPGVRAGWSGGRARQRAFPCARAALLFWALVSSGRGHQTPGGIDPGLRAQGSASEEPFDVDGARGRKLSTDSAVAAFQWDDPAAWEAGAVPAPGSVAVVPPHHVVELRGGRREAGTLVLLGCLVISDSADQQLEAERIIILGGCLQAGTAWQPRRHNFVLQLGAVALSRQVSQALDAPWLSELAPSAWRGWVQDPLSPGPSGKLPGRSSVLSQGFQVSDMSESLRVPLGSLLVLGHLGMVAEDVSSAPWLEARLIAAAEAGQDMVIVDGAGGCGNLVGSEISLVGGWSSSERDPAATESAQVMGAVRIHSSVGPRQAAVTVLGGCGSHWDLGAAPASGVRVQVALDAAGQLNWTSAQVRSADGDLGHLTLAVATIAKAALTHVPSAHSLASVDDDGDGRPDMITALRLAAPLQHSRSPYAAPAAQATLRPRAVLRKRTIVIQSSITNSGGTPPASAIDVAWGRDGSAAITAGTWVQHARWKSAFAASASWSERRRFFSGSVQLDGVELRRMGRQETPGQAQKCAELSMPVRQLATLLANNASAASWENLPSVTAISDAIACGLALSGADGSTPRSIVPASEGQMVLASAPATATGNLTGNGLAGLGAARSHPRLSPHLAPVYIHSGAPVNFAAPLDSESETLDARPFALTIAGAVSPDDVALAESVGSTAIPTGDFVFAEDQLEGTERTLGNAAVAALRKDAQHALQARSTSLGHTFTARPFAPTMRSSLQLAQAFAAAEQGATDGSLSPSSWRGAASSYVRRSIIAQPFGGALASIATSGVDLAGITVLLGQASAWPAIVASLPFGRLACTSVMYADSDAAQHDTSLAPGPAVALIGGPAAAGGILTHGLRERSGLLVTIRAYCDREVASSVAQSGALRLSSALLTNSPASLAQAAFGAQLLKSAHRTWIHSGTLTAASVGAWAGVVDASPYGLPPALANDPTAHYPASTATSEASACDVGMDVVLGPASHASELCGVAPGAVSAACRTGLAAKSAVTLVVHAAVSIADDVAVNVTSLVPDLSNGMAIVRSQALLLGCLVSPRLDLANAPRSGLLLGAATPAVSGGAALGGATTELFVVGGGVPPCFGQQSTTGSSMLVSHTDTAVVPFDTIGTVLNPLTRSCWAGPNMTLALPAPVPAAQLRAWGWLRAPVSDARLIPLSQQPQRRLAAGRELLAAGEADAVSTMRAFDAVACVVAAFPPAADLRLAEVDSVVTRCSAQAQTAACSKLQECLQPTSSSTSPVNSTSSAVVAVDQTPGALVPGAVVASPGIEPQVLRGQRVAKRVSTSPFRTERIFDFRGVTVLALRLVGLGSASSLAPSVEEAAWPLADLPVHQSFGDATAHVSPGSALPRSADQQQEVPLVVAGNPAIPASSAVTFVRLGRPGPLAVSVVANGGKSFPSPLAAFWQSCRLEYESPALVPRENSSLFALHPCLFAAAFANGQSQAEEAGLGNVFLDRLLAGNERARHAHLARSVAAIESVEAGVFARWVMDMDARWPNSGDLRSALVSQAQTPALAAAVAAAEIERPNIASPPVSFASAASSSGAQDAASSPISHGRAALMPGNDELLAVALQSSGPGLRILVGAAVRITVRTAKVSVPGMAGLLGPVAWLWAALSLAIPRALHEDYFVPQDWVTVTRIAAVNASVNFPAHIGSTGNSSGGASWAMGNATCAWGTALDCVAAETLQAAEEWDVEISISAPAADGDVDDSQTWLHGPLAGSLGSSDGVSAPNRWAILGNSPGSPTSPLAACTDQVTGLESRAGPCLRPSDVRVLAAGARLFAFSGLLLRDLRNGDLARSVLRHGFAERTAVDALIRPRNGSAPNSGGVHLSAPVLPAGSSAVLRHWGLEGLAEFAELAESSPGQPPRTVAHGTPARVVFSTPPAQLAGTLADGSVRAQAARAAATTADGGFLMTAPVAELQDAQGTTVVALLSPWVARLTVVGEPELSAAETRAFGGLDGSRVSAVLGGQLEVEFAQGFANFSGVYVRTQWLRTVIVAQVEVLGTPFSARSAPFAIVPEGFDPVPSGSRLESAPRESTPWWVTAFGGDDGLIAFASALVSVLVSVVVFVLVERRDRATQLLAQVDSKFTAAAARKNREAVELAKAANVADEGGPVRQRPGARGSGLAAGAHKPESHPESDDRAHPSQPSSPVDLEGAAAPAQAISSAGPAAGRVDELEAFAIASRRSKLRKAWALPGHGVPGNAAEPPLDHSGPPQRPAAGHVELATIDEQAERVIARMESDGRL